MKPSDSDSEVASHLDKLAEDLDAGWDESEFEPDAPPVSQPQPPALKALDEGWGDEEAPKLKIEPPIAKPAPAPAPVVAKPAPAPVVAKPAPAPVVAKPAPAPVVAKPAPAPVAKSEPVTAKPAPVTAKPAAMPTAPVIKPAATVAKPAAAAVAKPAASPIAKTTPIAKPGPNRAPTPVRMSKKERRAAERQQRAHAAQRKAERRKERKVRRREEAKKTAELAREQALAQRAEIAEREKNRPKAEPSEPPVKKAKPAKARAERPSGGRKLDRNERKAPQKNTQRSKALSVAISIAVAAAIALALLNLRCSSTPPPPAVEPAPASASALPPAPVSVAAVPSAAPTRDFSCNLVLGLTVTQEWYGAGFEALVGDDHWEAILQPHTFVEHWADPNYEAWTKAPDSPCAQNATSPDRVLLFAANWTFTTADEWVPKLDGAADVIKAKYPSVRQIVLLPMVRAPGNATCGDPKSIVSPFVDEAMDKVAAKRPDLIKVGPHFELKSCDLFKKGGPHFTEQGGTEVAKLIAEHFAKPNTK